MWINGAKILDTTAATVTLSAIPQFALQNAKVLPMPAEPAPGGRAYLELCLKNTVNKGGSISNIVITAPLPAGLTYDTTYTPIGIDKSAPPFVDPSADGLTAAYTIDYETFGGTVGNVGTFYANVNTEVLFSSIPIAPGDRITKLLFNIGVFPMGASEVVPPSIQGTAKASLPLPTYIINHIHASWDGPEGEETYITNKTTVVNEVFMLNPKYKRISPSGNTSVQIGDTLRYKAKIDCYYSYCKEPIIAFLLPNQVEYAGNVTMNYTSFFEGITPPTDPVAVVIPNFSTSGKTLVKWTFEDYTFLQLATASIEFDVMVKAGATGTVSMYMLQGDVADKGIVPTGLEIFYDPYDIAQNGTVGAVYARTPTLSNAIAFTTSMSSDKKVKGELDEDFVEEPLIGKTYAGGSINYKLSINNTGNSNLESIEIVDILPHPGDTGVIETSVLRGSQFTVYSMGQVTAQITPLLPGQAQPTLLVYYSQSYDPVRFGANLQTTGTVDDWTLTPPVDDTTLASFKVVTQNTRLYPGQTMEVYFVGKAPVGTPDGEVAWNSSAAKVTYRNQSNVLTTLLPVEPEKVGVTIENPVNPCSIGGFIWDDLDKDGIYTPGEPGLNDMVLGLYNSQGQMIKATTTAPNQSGSNGYYVFANLLPGIYYVKLIINPVLYQYTVQRLDDPNGSVFNIVTGVTPPIQLTNEQPDVTIIGGVIKRPMSERMEDVLIVNKSANKMLKNVIMNQLLIGMKLEDTIDISYTIR